MTLIVGIRCQDGVVLGADQAATLGTLGRDTVAQSTPHKVEIVGDKALIATSGPVGLGQIVKGEFAKALTSKKGFRGETWEVTGQIRELLWPHIRQALSGAQAAAPVVGPAASQSALMHTLIAIPVKTTPTLFQFDYQCAPEEATADLPFVAIGSGQAIADPFLAFLKDVRWTDGELPTINEGEFSTFWTIQESVRAAPGYIGGQPVLFRIAGDGERWKAEQLSGPELGEHAQAVEAARRALRGPFAPGTPQKSPD